MNDKARQQVETIKARAKAQTFGVEMECVGVPPARLRDAVLATLRQTAATDLNTATTFSEAQGRDRYSRLNPAIKMADGRLWVFTHDGSLSDYQNSCEIVSPILTHADMPLLQAIARAARAAGARADHSCGLHVHVGIQDFTPYAIKALVAQVGMRETLIVEAVGMHANRRYYAGMLPAAYRASFKTARIEDGITAQEFGLDAGRQQSPGRYVGLNLTSLASRPTVEFRYFNGTLHAGKIKSYVQLCTHLCAVAIETKVAVFARKTTKPLVANLATVGAFLREFCIERKDPEYATAYELLTRRFRRGRHEGQAL